MAKNTKKTSVLDKLIPNRSTNKASEPIVRNAIRGVAVNSLIKSAKEKQAEAEQRRAEEIRQRQEQEQAAKTKQWQDLSREAKRQRILSGYLPF